MCVCFACTRHFACTTHFQSQGGQKGHGILELELQMVTRRRVSARNQTWVFCKSSKHS